MGLVGDEVLNIKRVVYMATEVSEHLKWLAHIRDVVASMHKINA
jgi:hypothetical protein